MSQSNIVKRSSPCGKIVTFLNVDTPASVYHDFCLSEKAWAIDIMVQAQKQEEELAVKQKECCDPDDCIPE